MLHVDLTQSLVLLLDVCLPLAHPRPPGKIQNRSEIEERDLTMRLFPLCGTMVHVEEIQINDDQNHVVYICTTQMKTKTTTSVFNRFSFSAN